jgi:hypothetical protein
MDDHELVRTAIRKIFLKNGYDPNGSPAQRDFEFICGELEAHTRTLISVSTLKRLHKGDFSRTPQVATLNALAIYLGYGNWQGFKAELRSETNGDAHTEPVIAKEKIPRKKSPVSFKWLVAVVALVLVAAAFGFLNHRTKSLLSGEPLYFSARKTTGNSIPNTVVFSYDVTNVKADSFFIQQSWDKRRRVRVDKNSHVLSDIYYEPGYHVAKLIANDSILKTVDVSIPTDAWMCYTSSFFGKELPQYIRTGKALADINLPVNDAELQKNHIHTDDNTVLVCSYFPGVLIGDGDNFTCNMRVRLLDARSAQCPFLMFEIYCQRRFMYFMSMNKGCASQAAAEFGDNRLSGKTTDLSPLCFDLQQWADVNWQVKDKKVTISINGQKVFETAYKTSCGKVAGMGLISNGFYEISLAQLKGMDGNRITEMALSQFPNPRNNRDRREKLRSPVY